MHPIYKQYQIPLLLAITSIVGYLSFAYNLERSDFVKLISLYSALFYISYLLIQKFKLDFWSLASLGLVLRLIFIPAIPNLSQDFYRFIWDGRLMTQGISPYLFNPNSSISLAVTVEQSQQLIEGMGSLSAGHFSNYPPVNQLFFAIASLFAGKSILGSVIVLRIIIILADIGILYFGKKLLEKLNLPVQKLFWYFLNPFVIIELTGNLHFEGVMLFFLIWALFLLFKGKWIWAAVLMGISISVKLIPLVFLPLFFQYFMNDNKVPKALKTFGIPLQNLIVFNSIVGFTVLLTFLPFLSVEFIHNFSVTLALWFQSFEFNASFYYIIRWLGFQIVGWNIIGTVGTVTPIIIVFCVFGLAFFRKTENLKQLLTAMLLALSFYFLLSTTVHPWYIATPLLLSVFTKYKFPIVWSFVVMLSYSAYGKEGFDENLWWVTLEYLVVIGMALWELFPKKRINLYGFKSQGG